MKTRTDGFLSQSKINQNDEIFDYIRELHEYLWFFVKHELPFASGKLDDYLDLALTKVKYNNRRKNEIKKHY